MCELPPDTQNGVAIPLLRISCRFKTKRVIVLQGLHWKSASKLVILLKERSGTEPEESYSL